MGRSWVDYTKSGQNPIERMMDAIMMLMNEAELTTYIIKHLSDEDDPNDIIPVICQEMDCTWSEAEAYLDRVREERQPEIVQRQFPILFTLAFLIFVSGLALTGYGVYITVNLLINYGSATPPDITTTAMPIFSEGADPIAAFQAVLRPYAKFFFDFSANPFSAIAFGIAMMFGSLLGMRQAWSGLLSRWFERKQND
jgi:hypothetical protein